MEIVIEILVEVYLELMFLIVPEEKALKYRVPIALFAFVVLAGVLALFLWGGSLLAEGDRWGIAPVAVAVIVSVVQIGGGIYLYCRKSK